MMSEACHLHDRVDCETCAAIVKSCTESIGFQMDREALRALEWASNYGNQVVTVPAEVDASGIVYAWESKDGRRVLLPPGVHPDDVE